LLFWGLSLIYLGESGAAVTPLQMAVACQPGDFDAQLALGEACLTIGNSKDAKTHLENAARINPNDPRPTQALERLQKH
jgi:Flp pilus assembly protein TadD